MSASHTGHDREVQHLFDDLSPSWGAKYRPGGSMRRRLDRFAAALAWPAHLARGSRVLDLGCGTGDLARHLADSGYEVDACDVSPKMLASARLAHGDAIRWHELPPAWTTLPFPSATFDAVVASSVLEYVDDPAAVISECARVLRDGGATIFTVPNERNLVRRAEAALVKVAAPMLRHARGGGRFARHARYLLLSKNRFPVASWVKRCETFGLRRIAMGADHADAASEPLAMIAFRK